MAGWALPRKHAIVARRLSSSGQRIGPEVRLNSRPIDRSKPGASSYDFSTIFVRRFARKQ
jgi:hypothetical protein